MGELTSEIVAERGTKGLSDLLKILFISSLAGLGVYVVLAIAFSFSNNDAIRFAVIGTTLFSDFAETLSYGLVPNPYTGEYGIKSIYPPLSILMFLPFTVFCRGALNGYIAGEISLQQLSANGGFVVSFLLYYFINLAIVMYVVAKFTQLKGKDLAYLLTVVACFGPVLFLFVRANNTFTVFTFALLFFYLNSSDVRWKKEFSYLCFAVSAMMKVYPLLMVFYLLWREKGLNKLWSVLKALGYTLVVVLVPFVFIEGGFSNIPVLLDNVFGFSSGTSIDPTLEEVKKYYSGSGATTWGTNITIDTMVYFLCVGLSHLTGIANMGGLHGALSAFLRYSLVLIAVVLPCLNPTSQKRKEFVTLAVGTYLLFPGIGNGYCLSLVVIPLLFTIAEWDALSRKDKIFYFVCFVLVANPVFYTYGWFIPQALANYALVVKSVVAIVCDDVDYFKQKKVQKQTVSAQ